MYVRTPFEASTDKRLGAMDKGTLLALCSFADRDGKAFPSLTKIAERAGIHRATVAKSLNNLETLGYITRNQRIRKGKSEFDSTLYAIPGIAIHQSDEFPAPG